MEVAAQTPGDEPVDETLDAARDLLREREPEGWPEVSERVCTRLRGVVAPAQVFAAYAVDGEPGGRSGSRISVSSRVILPRLRARLDSDQRVADVLRLVEDSTDRDRLASVQVDLVCRFGTDLRGEGEQARRTAGEVLRDLLGSDPAFEAGRDVRVQVVDVVTGDPRQA